MSAASDLRVRALGLEIFGRGDNKARTCLASLRPGCGLVDVDATASEGILSTTVGPENKKNGFRS